MFNLLKKHFTLEDGSYGKCLIVTNAWSQDIEQYIINHQIPELVLNHSKGWEGKNLSFLEKLNHLKAFTILDFSIKDISPIHNLHNLKKIIINTYCKTSIDFSNFSKLEDCYIQFRPKTDSIFDCTTLHSLSINGYTKKDTNQFSKLHDLESLSIYNSPITDLSGLGSLNKLKFLGLYRLTKLKSLKGIESLSNLEKLSIDTCKGLSSIVEIGHLKNLNFLGLNNCGDINSLKPLESLNKLKSVFFVESTNIVDGNLSVLEKFNLIYPKTVAFMNRKHYTHKREDFN